MGQRLDPSVSTTTAPTRSAWPPGTYRVKLETFGSSLSTGPGPAPRFAGPAQIVVSAGKTVTADFSETIELR
jgi:transglutaminase-like putative cysteine protease